MTLTLHNVNAWFILLPFCPDKSASSISKLYLWYMQTLRLFCCDISSSQKRCTEIGNCKLINNDTYSIYHFHSKSDNWRLKSVQTASKSIQIYNSGLILFMYPFFFAIINWQPVLAEGQALEGAGARYSRSTV